MHIRSISTIQLWLLMLVCCCLSNLASAAAISQNHRHTPLVRAIQECSASVVNLRGRKTVAADPNSSSHKLKQVNGMGTAVVIDPRGYLLTNYHVVQGVKEIEVTTNDKQKTIARLLAHDPITDLAILKIELDNPLPKIKLGTSNDLMLAETVTAVGNAYGYEHTVTVGIVSQLNRTVQVNDHQVYRNLIQTDAAINPGNSGGPLLNMNGEMIGINVAVRIGAQGIAFAIPVDDALEVAADLISQLADDQVYHGMTTRTAMTPEGNRVIVDTVEPNSPAALAGVSRGDQIESINGQPVTKEVEFYCQLIDRLATQPIRIEFKSGSAIIKRTLALETRTPTTGNLAWSSIGLRLSSVNTLEMSDLNSSYKRGLRVTRVRPNSPAEQEGIMPGDILVAMHGYKTETLQNVAYILQRSDALERNQFMFYLLRDKEPFWGKLRVAQLPSR